MTIEVRVQPGVQPLRRRAGSSRAGRWRASACSPRPIARDCLTTPKTLGEPNSVRLRGAGDQLAAAGLCAHLDPMAPPNPDHRVRVVRRLEAEPGLRLRRLGGRSGVDGGRARVRGAALRRGPRARVAVGVAAAAGAGAGTPIVTVGGSDDEPQPAATTPPTTIDAA